MPLGYPIEHAPATKAHKDKPLTPLSSLQAHVHANVFTTSLNG